MQLTASPTETAGKGRGAPISGKQELVAYLEAGCKPSADWRIGTEHEKFGFTQGDTRPACPTRARAASALCWKAWMQGLRLGCGL